MSREEELLQVELFMRLGLGKTLPAVPSPDLGRVTCHEQENMLAPVRGADGPHFTRGVWIRAKSGSP